MAETSNYVFQALEIANTCYSEACTLLCVNLLAIDYFFNRLLSLLYKSINIITKYQDWFNSLGRSYRIIAGHKITVSFCFNVSLCCFSCTESLVRATVFFIMPFNGQAIINITSWFVLIFCQYCK